MGIRLYTHWQMLIMSESYQQHCSFEFKSSSLTWDASLLCWMSFSLLKFLAAKGFAQDMLWGVTSAMQTTTYIGHMNHKRTELWWSKSVESLRSEFPSINILLHVYIFIQLDLLEVKTTVYLLFQANWLIIVDSRICSSTIIQMIST